MGIRLRDPNEKPVKHCPNSPACSILLVGLCNHLLLFEKRHFVTLSLHNTGFGGYGMRLYHTGAEEIRVPDIHCRRMTIGGKVV